MQREFISSFRNINTKEKMGSKGLFDFWDQKINVFMQGNNLIKTGKQDTLANIQINHFLYDLNIFLNFTKELVSMVITQPLLVAWVQQGCRVSVSQKRLCSEKRYCFFFIAKYIPWQI